MRCPLPQLTEQDVHWVTRHSGHTFEAEHSIMLEGSCNFSHLFLSTSLVKMTWLLLSITQRTFLVWTPLPHDTEQELHSLVDQIGHSNGSHASISCGFGAIRLQYVESTCFESYVQWIVLVRVLLEHDFVHELHSPISHLGHSWRLQGSIVEGKFESQ